jgi:hypothetical protein
MKWSIPFVLAALVSLVACENYEKVFQAGYPQCQWESTSCRSDSQCCSGWCPNHECEMRP